MTFIAIPEWTPHGLLPPIDARSPTSATRSPYSVPLLDVVMRFSTTAPRRQILSGLMDYRAAMHDIGLVAGMQWLDGSFMEQVELLEARHPRDLDVVSFVHTPSTFAPSAAGCDVLDNEKAKARFRVDGYFVGLDELPPRNLVAHSAYWYGLWSHRRNQAWKGYLQVDLDPASDVLARRWLARYDASTTET